MMSDRILAVLALVCMAAFLSVLIVRVPHPDLVIVCVAVILMAAYDFFRELRRRSR